MERPTSPKTGAFQTPGTFRQLFYVDADISRGWPERATKTLCKMGVTTKTASARCSENEARLRNEFDIEGDMEVVFEAAGFITEVETPVVKATRPWACEELEDAPSTEWRLCRPRQLARIAVLLTLRIGSQRATSNVQGPFRDSPERARSDLRVFREPVSPAPSACQGQVPGGPLPLARPRPWFHPANV